MQAHLDELARRNLPCIYLDLRLSDRFAMAQCPEMEKMGFFFAGILPETAPDGDVLRLQFLNKLELDLDQVVLVSDLGRELMQYIRDCR